MDKKSLIPFTILMLFISGFTSAQSLFDSAISDSASENNSSISESHETSPERQTASKPEAEFSGSAKGLFGTSVNRKENNFSTESSYAEFRGKVTASPSDNLKAFSEIVINRNGSNTDETEIELREAYINIYGRLLDFSVGEKIIVWGKADAFNPTNKITPYTNKVISSNEDDRRMGNLLAETKLNLYPFTITALWIPFYKETELPSFIETELIAPEKDIEHSAFAFKTDFENSSFDFSVSYFNGYNPSPGISGINAGIMELKPYRVHNIGFDFSTTVSDYGLRGETAFFIPFKDDEKVYIPSAEISYIAGIDRTIGDLTLILQYSGKYIPDFIAKNDLTTLNPLEVETENFNRIISSQTEQLTHSAVFRASLDLFYETLSLETVGNYNFTTEEFMLRPLAVWDAADSLSVSAGAVYYAGEDNTLFGMLEEKGSSVFTELKLSF